MKNGKPGWILLALVASATALAAGPKTVSNPRELAPALSKTSSVIHRYVDGAANSLSRDSLNYALAASDNGELQNANDGALWLNAQQNQALGGFLRYQVSDRSYIEPAYFTQHLGSGVDVISLANVRRSRFSKSAITTAPVAGEFTLGSVTMGSELDRLTLFISLSKTDRGLSTGLSTGVGSDNGSAITATADFSDGFDSHSGMAQFSDLTLKNERFEAQLSSNNDRAIQWLVGIYHEDTQINADYRLFQGSQYGGPEGLDRDQHQYGERAVFGKGSLELPGNVNLSVGLRYLDYDISRRINRGAVAEGLALSAGGNSIDSNSSAEVSNYRVTLSWDYSDDSQAYISMSDAIRPTEHHRSTLGNNEGQVLVCDQGVSAAAVERGRPVDGDSVENFELGLKAEPASGLRVNAALYRIERRDIRQPLGSLSTCGLNLGGNISEAVSMGLELGLTAVLTEYLTINAGLGYSDGQFSEALDSSDPERASEALELSWSLSADWSQPIGDGELFVFGSVSYVDDSPILASLNGANTLYFSNDGSEQNTQQTMVDVRLGYNSGNRWRAAVFIDNLTDEQTVYSGDGTVFNLPGYDRGARNRPRTVGVSASYSF